MRGIIKVFSVLFFSLGMFLTAKAQDDNVKAPAEDAIVCTQVAENVFDCYVQPGGEFEEYEGEEGTREEDLNQEEMDRENQDQTIEPEENEDPEEMESEDEFWSEPETPADPSDPYYQEMNLPIRI